MWYCISYSELRQFLTSAAVFVSSSQEITPSGAIVPHEITPKSQDGKQPVGVGDNWDHNERTVDGKHTTHAMTSIIMSPNTHVSSLPRIPRVAERSLGLECIPGRSLASVIHKKT